jgi:hypothetical protein
MNASHVYGINSAHVAPAQGLEHASGGVGGGENGSAGGGGGGGIGSTGEQQSPQSHDHGAFLSVLHETWRKARQVESRHLREHESGAGGIGGGGGDTIDGTGGRLAKHEGATPSMTFCTSKAPNLNERATSAPGTSVGSLPAHSR